MSIRLFTAYLAMLSAPALVQGQSLTDDEIAALHTPPSLESEAAEIRLDDGYGPQVSWVTVPYDVGAGVDDHLVVVYSNTLSMVAKMVRRDSAAPVGELEIPLSGFAPAVSKIDLDGVAPLELELSVGTMSQLGNAAILGWRAGGFVNVGAAVTEGLHDFQMADLNDDGAVDLLVGLGPVPTSRPELEFQSAIYQWSNGRYERAGFAKYFDWVTGPTTKSSNFVSVGEDPGPWELVAVNGPVWIDHDNERHQSSRAGNATITLDEVEMLAPAAFVGQPAAVVVSPLRLSHTVHTMQISVADEGMVLVVLRRLPRLRQ